jgi:hypothetical protein
VQCHLDDIGVRHGSELSSLSRDQLRSWERFLAPLREQRFDLLQIGVADGASLRTWREWFPAARLVGLDPRRLFLDSPIAGCTIVHGNQTDLGALQPLVRDYQLRLIVDDGSHHPDDHVQTFQLLFPWLEAESVYICAGIGELKSAPGVQLEQSGAPPEQPGDRPGRLADRMRRSAGARDRRTGAAWFAELGRELAAREIRDRYRSEEPTREFIRSKTTGVFLLRGSVVVTS